MLRLPETWPAEFRWIREAYMKDWESLTANDRTNGGARITTPEWGLGLSPRFFVANDDKLVTSTTGVYGWTNTIAPVLEKLVGK
jgi:hypothetical protein